MFSQLDPGDPKSFVFETQRVNILMVDDRPDGLMALEAVLSRPEYHLVKASSGSEAISLLSEWNFALILLDVQMPKMDGFQTAHTIKQSELFKHIPIILITAINKEMSHISRGYREGVADYIFKPFEPDVLRAKVAVFVDLYKKNLKIREQARLLLESERWDRERKLTELELENLRRYRNLADAIPHIVWKFQYNTIADYFNHFWNQYTGLTLEQSLGKGWQSALHPEDLPVFLELWQASKDKNENFEAECRIKRKVDGSYRWHLIRMVKETRVAGEVVGWLGTCTEIHHSKVEADRLHQSNDMLEERVQERTMELINSKRSLEKEMAERMKAQKEILEISEREQKRIGQDLHDGMAQQLAGISFKSKILQQKLILKNMDEAEDAFEILDLLKKAIAETKRLARGFYPIELERHGLFAALKELAINTEKMFYIVCEYHWDPAVKINNKAVESHLYRIVQEAIHNGIKHGKAKRIRVSMTPKYDGIFLSIENNGETIANIRPAMGGMGLRTMEYRAKTIGASLSIEKMPFGGTCVAVTLPLTGSDAEPNSDTVYAGKKEEKNCG